MASTSEKYPPNTWFLEILEKHIKLTESKEYNAITSRDNIMDRLPKRFSEALEDVKWVCNGPVLGGSFDKKTHTREGFDFDVLLAILPNPKIPQEWKYRQISKTDYRVFDNNGDALSSIQMINRLFDAASSVAVSLRLLEEPYITRPSITMESRGVSYDLLPAIDVGNGTFLVPKGGRENTWVISRTKDEKHLVIELEKKNPGFRNCVKIVKYIMKNRMWKISSYAIECASYHCFEHAIWSTSIGLNVCTILGYLQECCKRGIIMNFWNDVNLLEDGFKETHLKKILKEMDNVIYFIRHPSVLAELHIQLIGNAQLPGNKNTNVRQ